MRFFISYGGGTEIRTLGTLRHGSFQDCCIKPLCHPSEEMWGEYIEECLFVKIIFENPVSYFCSSVFVVELEYRIRDDDSFWFSEFLVFF